MPTDQQIKPSAKEGDVSILGRKEKSFQDGSAGRIFDKLKVAFSGEKTVPKELLRLVNYLLTILKSPQVVSDKALNAEIAALENIGFGTSGENENKIWDGIREFFDLLDNKSPTEASKIVLRRMGMDFSPRTIKILLSIVGSLLLAAASCGGPTQETPPPNNEAPPTLSPEQLETAVDSLTQVAGTQTAVAESGEGIPTPVPTSEERLESILGLPVKEFLVLDIIDRESEIENKLIIDNLQTTFDTYIEMVKASNEFSGKINFKPTVILVHFEGQPYPPDQWDFYTFFYTSEIGGDTNDFRLDMVVQDSQHALTTVELQPVLITKDGKQSLAFAQMVNAASPEYNPETGEGPALDFPIVVFDTGHTPAEIEAMTEEQLADMTMRFYPHGLYFIPEGLEAYQETETANKVLSRDIPVSSPETPERMGDEFLSGVSTFEGYLVHKGEDGIIDSISVNDFWIPLNTMTIDEDGNVIIDGMGEVGLPIGVYQAMRTHNLEVTEPEITETPPGPEPEPEVETFRVDDYCGFGPATKTVHPIEFAEDPILGTIEVRRLSDVPQWPNVSRQSIDGLTITSMQIIGVDTDERNVGGENIPSIHLDELIITFGYLGSDGLAKELIYKAYGYITTNDFIKIENFATQFIPGQMVDLLMIYNHTSKVPDNLVINQVKGALGEGNEWLIECVYQPILEGDVAFAKLEGDLSPYKVQLGSFSHHNKND